MNVRGSIWTEHSAAYEAYIYEHLHTACVADYASFLVGGFYKCQFKFWRNRKAPTPSIFSYFQPYIYLNRFGRGIALLTSHETHSFIILLQVKYQSLLEQNSEFYLLKLPENFFLFIHS